MIFLVFTIFIYISKSWKVRSEQVNECVWAAERKQRVMTGVKVILSYNFPKFSRFIWYFR